MDLTKLKKSFSDYLPKLKSGEGKIHLFEFAGAIGSGKSATTESVVEMMTAVGIPVTKLNEDILSEDNKKAIDDFYASGSNDDGELENTICGNRIKMLINALNVALDCDNDHIIVSDRAVEEDLSFIDMLIKKHRASDNDQKVLDKLYTVRSNICLFLSNINETGSRVDHHIVYLNPGLYKALDRIRRRGRPNEQQMDVKTLRMLTKSPYSFRFGKVHIIDNSYLSAKETAFVAFEEISEKVFGKRDRVLVSMYGVPGSGKTYMAKKFCEKMPKFYDDLCVLVLDRSDESEMEEEQRKVYEGENGALGNDDMQNFIDKRRIDSFAKVIGDVSPLITVTDVGPLTSQIFRKFYGSKEDDSYKNFLANSLGFDICLNVVIKPVGGMNEVRKHIDKRGRPGEYQYFTECRLGEISDIIAEQVLFGTNMATICENDYSEVSVEKMFHVIMETMINAVIRDKTIRRM